MKPRERLLRVIGAASAEQVKTARDSAWNAGYREGYEDGNSDEPTDTNTGSWGYRSFSASARNWAAAPFHTILETVRVVDASNPMGFRALQIKCDHIVGGGVQFTSENDDLNEILKAFDIDNKLTTRTFDFAKSLFTDGVLLNSVFVRNSDGRVRIGIIDPMDVETIIQHPENSLEHWAVVMKEDLGYAEQSWRNAPSRRRVYRILRRYESNPGGQPALFEGDFENRYVTAEQASLEDWEMAMLREYDLDEYTGTVLYTKVNTPPNAEFGMSDLARVADYLDQLDTVLFALAQREQLADYFTFEVIVDGDRDTIVRRTRELMKNPPKKGSINVHNASESWVMHSPNLRQSSSIETVTALSRAILGGLGLPEHWYGKGDDTNRATAIAQGDPTWRSLERAQGEIERHLQVLLDFTRDQSIIAGSLLEIGDDSFDIIITMPEMTSKDLDAIATTMTKVAQALTVAEAQAWITRERAAELWSKLMSEAGVDYEFLDELNAILTDMQQLMAEPGPAADVDALIEEALRANS